MARAYERAAEIPTGTISDAEAVVLYEGNRREFYWMGFKDGFAQPWAAVGRVVLRLFGVTSRSCGANGPLRPLKAGHYLCHLPADHPGPHASTGEGPDEGQVQWR